MLFHVTVAVSLTFFDLHFSWAVTALRKYREPPFLLLALLQAVHTPLRQWALLNLCFGPREKTEFRRGCLVGPLFILQLLSGLYVKTVHY